MEAATEEMVGEVGTAAAVAAAAAAAEALTGAAAVVAAAVTPGRGGLRAIVPARQPSECLPQDCAWHIRAAGNGLVLLA